MSNEPAFSRRLMLGMAATFLTAGCADLVGPPPAPRLYTLRPVLDPAQAGAKLPGALAIALPTADASLDTGRIAIMRQPSTLDYYADAAWTDHLPVLVQNALVEAFEASGAIDAMADGIGGVRADYLLVSAIRDFEARYATPDGAPTAVARLDVHVIDRRKQKSLSHFLATAEIAATRNSIDAAVAALNKALSAVLADSVQKTVAAISSKSA